MQTIVWTRPKLFRKLERPIFVVGCCNSGTTILWRALLAHPELSGPPREGQDIKELPRCMHQFIGRETFRLWALPQFSAAYHMTEKDYDRRTAERIASIYLDHCKPGTRFCEKSPPNSLRTRFLQSIFPDATFVIIVRNGIAISEGIRRKRLYDPERPHMAGLKTDIRDAAQQWLHANRRLLKDRRYLRESILVHYEDLVTSAESVLSATLWACGCGSGLFSAPAFVAGLNEEQTARLTSHEKSVVGDILSATLASLGYAADENRSRFARELRANTSRPCRMNHGNARGPLSLPSFA